MFINGIVTSEGIEMINSWLVNVNKANMGAINLPKKDSPDIHYACETNIEMNSITTSIFR